MAAESILKLGPRNLRKYHNFKKWQKNWIFANFQIRFFFTFFSKKIFFENCKTFQLQSLPYLISIFWPFSSDTWPWGLSLSRCEFPLRHATNKLFLLHISSLRFATCLGLEGHVHVEQYALLKHHQDHYADPISFFGWSFFGKVNIFFHEFNSCPWLRREPQSDKKPWRIQKWHWCRT